jgi:NAD(P)-dependent dehydrogenase (short-subunit alcohol dehydrogenase family)
MLKTPSFRLDNKRALVIGASSGIGQACAIALAEYGAEVVVAARREKQLMETIALIEKCSAKAIPLVMDVTDIETSQQQIDELGPFNILLNSAGLARHSAALETTIADFDAVTEINFKSSYFITQAVAKGLIASKKSGSLINISSQMAHVGGVERAVYSATKHAVEGMTKSMAIEWGKYGIRVNTICPTFIKTALTASTLNRPEMSQWVKQKIKLNRIGEVQDIMGAVVFLASDASALITGSSLLIDGGWTAG